jgi:hypothetical protein
MKRERRKGGRRKDERMEEEEEIELPKGSTLPSPLHVEAKTKG